MFKDGLKSMGERNSFADKTIDFIASSDPALAAAIADELKRERRNIELIASENIVSETVLAAAGTILTNKYAEGYPAKRYYGGCEYVDVVENLAISRAKELFGAEHVNVQPHSGAQANTAVYIALLSAGDTIMGMSLAHGGHLTHGSSVNFSGKYFNVVPYGVDEQTQTIDYDRVEELALECKPKLIVAGASAYPRVIDFKRFSEIAKKVGAYLMVDMAHIAGLVAAGVHPSPVPAAGLGDYQRRVVENAACLAAQLREKGFDLVSGGTDNHLMLVDLRPFDITGKELEHRLDEVYITVNKNAIPGDPQKPTVTSGVRIGTPAVTTRGFGIDEMKTIAELIRLTAADFENSRDYVREQVCALCDRFPIY